MIFCIFNTKSFLHNLYSIEFTPGDFSTNLPYLYESNSDGVAFVTDLTQRSFNIKYAPARRLEFTKDRLYMFSPVYLYPKRSLLISVIDHQLQLLREAGLIRFWIATSTDDHKPNPKQREPTKLQIENVLAAFQIVALMYFISFIVFIIEIKCANYPRIKYVIDYLTY